MKIILRAQLVTDWGDVTEVARPYPKMTKLLRSTLNVL